MLQKKNKFSRILRGFYEFSYNDTESFMVAKANFPCFSRRSRRRCQLLGTLSLAPNWPQFSHVGRTVHYFTFHQVTIVKKSGGLLRYRRETYRCRKCTMTEDSLKDGKTSNFTIISGWNKCLHRWNNTRMRLIDTPLKWKKMTRRHLRKRGKENWE